MKPESLFRRRLLAEFRRCSQVHAYAIETGSTVVGFPDVMVKIPNRPILFIELKVFPNVATARQRRVLMELTGAHSVGLLVEERLGVGRSKTYRVTSYDGTMERQFNSLPLLVLFLISEEPLHNDTQKTRNCS